MTLAVVHVEHPNKRGHQTFLGCPDQVGKGGAESTCGLLQVVVGDLAEQVVDLKAIGNGWIIFKVI